MATHHLKHALPKIKSKNKKTKVLLENSIAIPIWLRKSVADYNKLGKKLHNILSIK